MHISYFNVLAETVLPSSDCSSFLMAGHEQEAFVLSERKFLVSKTFH